MGNAPLTCSISQLLYLPGANFQDSPSRLSIIWRVKFDMLLKKEKQKKNRIGPLCGPLCGIFAIVFSNFVVSVGIQISRRRRNSSLVLGCYLGTNRITAHSKFNKQTFLQSFYSLRVTAISN